MRRHDSAMSSVLGAIILLAILGMALVYVNAVHVPRQGAAMEMDAREATESSLGGVASRLGSTTPFTAHVPVRAEPASPPLLSGIVLSPAVKAGSFAFEPDGARLRVSHVTRAPMEGVPMNDPMRVDLGGGLMRVYDLGNATSAHPVGSLRVSVGGAYLDQTAYVLEAGALHQEVAGTSVAMAPPALQVSRGGTAAAPSTSFSWMVPVLAGAAREATVDSTLRLGFAPGPLVGGGSLVHSVTLEVETRSLAAWTELLRTAVGASGVVTVTATGPDAGTVRVEILPPPGTPAGVAAVEMDLWLVRHRLMLTG